MQLPLSPFEALEQAGLALVYYLGLVTIMRVAGKRLAGQTTTFDLLVLIALGVVLQTTVLRDGTAYSFVFIATVLAAHVGLARLCARSRRIRRIVRGAPRPLVWNGRVNHDALDEEGLSYDELLAGLRKLGYAHPRAVRLATLEETGHISAVAAARDGDESGTGRDEPAVAAVDDRDDEDDGADDAAFDADAGRPAPGRARAEPLHAATARGRGRPRPQAGHVRDLGDV